MGAKPWGKADIDRLGTLVKSGVDFSVIASEFGVTKDAIHSMVGRKKSDFWPGDTRSTRVILENIRAASKIPDNEDALSVSQDWQFTQDSGEGTVKNLKEPVKSLEDLARVCSIDLEVWDVTKWQVKAYQGFIKKAGNPSEGIPDEIETVDLYSVSASLSKKKGLNHREAIEALIRLNVERFPKIAPHQWVGRKTGTLLEIMLSDLHLEKLCWGEETGSNYDTDIAIKSARAAVGELISRAAHAKPERLVLVIGNDFFNVDNPEGTTTGGTRQDTDTRYKKAFEMAIQMMVGILFGVRDQFQGIDVIFVPGNHDENKGWFLAKVLEAYFQEAKDITIHVSPRSRHYYQWGQCLIGYTHGDKEKVSNLPLIMATEAKAIWSETKHHEWHLGHFHKQKEYQFVSVDEQTGVIVRHFPALSGTDAWHSKSGYIGNKRGCNACLWHMDDGLIATFFHYAD